METTSWQSDTPLREVMDKNFTGFNYYQLVKLLRQQNRNNPELGGREIHYSADLSAAFPRNEISDISHKKDMKTQKEVTTLKSPNFCIASVIGPLSEPYIEWMRDRARDGDPVMADFLDLFNNRLHAMRYLIKSHRFPGLHIGRPENSVQAKFIEALIGLLNNTAINKFKNVKALQHRKLLAIAGLLASQRRSAPLIERILGNLLNVPVKITQMVGAWCDKASEDITLLGKDNSILGKTTSIGAQVWDQQARILLQVGPLGFDTYNNLLPGQKAYNDLVSVLRYITNRAADYDVVLQADKNDIPSKRDFTRVSYPGLQQRDDSWPVRLGRTAWLAESDGGTMPRETRFTIPAFTVTS